MKKSFVSRYRWIILTLLIVLLAGATLLPSPSTSLAVFAYELVRRCPDRARNVPADEFLIIGHRGAAGYAVENTIPSMDEAMRRGANAIEIDLSMTRDSAIVLWHDWLPDDAIATARQTGAETGVLCKPWTPDVESEFYRATHLLTLDELRRHYGYALIESERRVEAHIPTLEEFLAWSSGASGLRTVFLDVKVPNDSALLAQAFISRVQKIIADARPSFDIVYLIAMENVFRAVEPMFNEGNVSFDREPPGGVLLEVCDKGSVATALARDNRYASLIIPITSTVAPWTTVRRIAECDVETSRGRVKLMVGTTNDPEKMRCLVGIGVHGIFTDFPDTLRGIVGR